MNRLTKKIFTGEVGVKDGDSVKSICFGCDRLGKCKISCNFYKAIEKLAAYENTGLEPEEVEQYKIFEDGLVLKYGCTLQQTLNLLKLYKQGLLIKLPCNVGDVVYKLEDYGEWIDNKVFIPIKCRVDLIFLGHDNKLYCDLTSIDDLLQVCELFEEIPINEIYLLREEAEKHWR